MIEVISLIAVANLLAEIARKWNVRVAFFIRTQYIQFHHNLIGWGLILSNLFVPNPYFVYFGVGLITHHYVRERW